MPVSRFAPSPTGRLHLGHAFSALCAWWSAEGDRFWLRMEDIDVGRCRPEYVDGIFEDLSWLGIEWDPDVWLQSERRAVYEGELQKLKAVGAVYPCFCTRKQILEEVARMGSAPHGPDGPVYPGTCREIGDAERSERIGRGEDHAWRLDMGRAIDMAGDVSWIERFGGQTFGEPELFGDVVLARKDLGLSYFLCSVVDDAAQGIELVTRGRDLWEATAVQVVLQRLLGYETPEYFHHRLVVDSDGKRLAKRNEALSIRVLRARGLSATEVLQLAGDSLNLA